MDYCTFCVCHLDCDAPIELIGNGVCDDEANNADCKYDGGDCSGCESDYAAYIASGYCIDENNNEACNYDGGDCCDPNANTDYCVLCICHLDCDASMEVIGNGVCNDEANNVDCKYDGGDCY